MPKKKRFDNDGANVHLEVSEPAVKLEDYISLVVNSFQKCTKHQS